MLPHRKSVSFCPQISYQSFWTLSANPHILAHRAVLDAAKAAAATPEQVTSRAKAFEHC
jgi:hypothetical protein